MVLLDRLRAGGEPRALAARHVGRVLRPSHPPEAPGARDLDDAGPPPVTHVPAAVAVAEHRRPVPSTTRSTGTLAEKVAASLGGREPLADSLPRRVAARRLRRGHRRGRGARRRVHRAARPGPRTGPGRRPRGWVDGQRRVDASACSRPLTARVGERMAHEPGRADRPAGRGHRDRACCSATSSQRVLGQYDLLVLDDDAAADAVYYVGRATSSRWRSASRSGRATSGCGSRSTRSRTGRSSPACRG